MNAHKNATARLIAVSCATFLCASQAHPADLVVVPSSRTTVEGSGNNLFPFHLEPSGMTSQRYQQVYASSEFAYTDPVRITHIAFRPDGTMGSPFSSTLPMVQINLSTTAAAPDKMSTTFAANVGSDDTLVFNGPLALSSASTGPLGGPKDFDIQIALTTPFVYDPAAGNLLLDVRNIEGGSTTLFDAHMQLGDTTSRLFSETVLDATGFTGGSTSFGLVTQFTVEPAVTLVPVDIKPGGCPNPFNVGAGGVLPVAIAGTATLDVTQIDTESIRLAGVAAVRHSLEDAATPYEPFAEKDDAADCTSQGPDGTVDLVLKFHVEELAAAIRADLERDPVEGEVLVLTLTGKMLESAGGASIQGEDVVIVVKAGKN